MKLLIFGPPGSGKGTAAAAICNKDKNYVHISTGDILRKEIEDNTELGQKAKVFIDQGHLVSDESLAEIVLNRLKSLNNFILDGYPRTVSQAEFIIKKIQFEGLIWLDVQEDISTGRMLRRGRNDDKIAIINERLKVYHEQTYDVLDFLIKNSTIPMVKINSNCSIKTMSDAVLLSLEDFHQEAIGQS